MNSGLQGRCRATCSAAAIVVGALLTPVSAASAADAKPAALKATPAAQGPKWGAHIDLEGKWGNRRSLGDIGLFAPLWQSPSSLFFTDIRGRLDDQNSREGNFGLGLRHMLLNGWNWGLYGYYDARRTGNGNLFQQATLGAELLSADFDLRVNGYLPFGSRERAIGTAGGAPFAEFANGTIEIVTPGSNWVLERALRGFDGEIGWRLPIFPVESLTQIRAYAGVFWFDGEGLLPDIVGPRGRLEMSFEQDRGPFAGSRLTLGAEVQHDKVRGTNAFAVARLRIPLQPAERPVARLNPQERRMTERVVRDVDIVAGEGNGAQATPEIREAAINAHNNTTVTDVVQADAAGGHAALLAEIANYNAGSIVIANGVFAVAGQTELKAGQTLLGGGAQLPLIGAVTNAQVTFTAPGAAGDLSGAVDGPDPIVLLAGNSVVGGMTIQNAGDSGPRGIYSTNITGATVFGSTIAMTNAAANGGTAIRVDVGSDNIKLIGNNIAAIGAGTAGIGVSSSDAPIVTGNSIVTADGPGMHFFTSPNAAIIGNTVTSVNRFALTMRVGSNDATISGNVLQSAGVGSGGLSAESSTGLLVSGNTFGPLIGSDGVINAISNAAFTGASTGNIDTSSAMRCSGDGTASGTVSFTTAPNCVFP